MKTGALFVGHKPAVQASLSASGCLLFNTREKNKTKTHTSSAELISTLSNQRGVRLTTETIET